MFSATWRNRSSVSRRVFGEVFGHPIEPFGEAAEFVGRADRHAVIQVVLADGLDSPIEFGDGPHDVASQKHDNAS